MPLPAILDVLLSQPPVERRKGDGQQGLLMLLMGAALLALLYVSQDNYLLFHGLAEGYSIAVAWGVFLVAWNGRRFLDNDFALFLGIGYLCVGLLDLFHLLAYRGMGVFPGHGANLPTQLWIAARSLQAGVFLAAPVFFVRRTRPILLLFGLLTLSMGLILLIFQGGFPDCYVEGQGLTPFKKVSELVIAATFGAAILILRGHRERLDAAVYRLLTATLFFAVTSELAFIFYVDVYGFSNLAGHYGKIFATYCIYRALVTTCIAKPHEFLFRELSRQKEALQQAGQRLEATVLARTKELQRTNDSLRDEIIRRREIEANLEAQKRALEERNQDLDDFSFIVSHDLRGPLFGIYNYAILLQEEYGPCLNEQGRKILATLGDLAAKQERQIAAILDYSRAGRVEFAEEPVDLEGLVLDVIEELQQLHGQVTAQIRIDSPLPRLRCDRVRVRQVFTNLMANALKYNDKAEKIVLVGCRLAAPPAAAGQECPADYVFSVRDNGIGIAPESHGEIFQIFRRLHASHLYGGGSGAGLTIVQKIIQRHGGRIWLESAPGEGSSFYFTLGNDYAQSNASSRQ